jgi:hypothetical protein
MPFGPLLEWLVPRVDELPPLVSGVGLLPRPQRFYFRFESPIETTRWNRGDDRDACLELRTEVACAIERAIAALRRSRRRDPERRLGVRLLRELSRPRAPRSTPHVGVADGGPPPVPRTA